MAGVSSPGIDRKTRLHGWLRNVSDPVRESLMNTVTRLRGGQYTAEQYTSMHEQQQFVGLTWTDRLDDLVEAIPDVEEMKVLDFGCGPRGGLAERFGESVIPHDPYVASYAASPWRERFDVVFSADVLEHLRPREIDDFAAKVRDSAAEHIFLVVSTRSAEKRLPNGANAHRTVKDGAWWHRHLSKRLGSEYSTVIAQADFVRQDVVLYFRRRPTRS